MFWPSHRFTLAAKWWLIGELARRNPELRAAPLLPESDVDVTLDLRGTGRAGNLFLSADGSVHLFLGEDGFELIEPFVLYHATDPRELVDEITRIMGWDGDANAASAQPLTYRLLAGIANAVTFDARDWDIVAIDEWHPEHFHTRFGEFVGLADVYDTARASSQPAGTWAITRDSEPRAVVTETASLYRRAPPAVDLTITFDHVDGSHRRLLATVLDLIDDR
jgi:hypothetical protein